MRQRSDFLILSILFCVAAIVVVFVAMSGGGHASTIAARVGPVNSALSLLFGAFCALWAQNTHRNAWLWFFSGLFFNIFAIAVLLYKNADDVKKSAAPLSH